MALLPPRRRTWGTRAVVTGAGSGIGRSISALLAERGGQVVCSDIDLDRAAETVEGIRLHGGTAFPVRCDVTDLEQVEALAIAADALFDRPVDLVVNNAGVGVGGLPVGELSMDDWRFTIAVNLWGVVHGCHVFVPRLRARQRAGVINLASAASFASAASMAPYNVSKAAVVSLTETLAAELAGTGVRVSVVCPTFVDTNITRDGRIRGGSEGVAQRAMSLTGRNAGRVARAILDGHDAGRLYIVPQVEAKLLWRIKRHAPNAYLRGASVVGRALSPKSSSP